MTSKLGRKKNHRMAVLKNLGQALISSEKIITTLPKAKALQPIVERWITIAKKANNTNNKDKQLANRRLLNTRVGNKKIVSKLVKDLGARNLKRSGGYTRILKLGSRLGDNADQVMMALVEKPVSETPKQKKKTKKTTKK